MNDHTIIIEIRINRNMNYYPLSFISMMIILIVTVKLNRFPHA